MFIYLTNAGTRDSVLINARCTIMMESWGEFTHVVLQEGMTINVVETPEQILEAIRAAK